jgi:hypothetical protein
MGNELREGASGCFRSDSARFSVMVREFSGLRLDCVDNSAGFPSSTVLGVRPVSGGGGLWDYLRTPAAQAVIWVAVLALLSIVGAWVVLKFRDQSTNDTLPSHGMLANFREMRDGGHLEEAEFRTIKTMLGDKLQGELSGTRPRGPVTGGKKTASDESAGPSQTSPTVAEEGADGSG